MTDNMRRRQLRRRRQRRRTRTTAAERARVARLQQVADGAVLVGAGPVERRVAPTVCRRFCRPPPR